MNAFKVQCVALRKQDYTLPEIVKKTGRSKTSVYFHIRHIPLSSAKKLSISESSRTRALHNALRRKGKSARAFQKFYRWNVKKVSLVAHLLFDGEIRPSGCVYHNRSRALIRHVERCMKEIYGFAPKRYRNPITGVVRTCHFNVALGAYMQPKADQLLEEISHLSLPLKRAFIRAFFDDEGCIDFRPHRNHRRTRGYQRDVASLVLLQSLLLSFGIIVSIEHPNEVVVSRKDNLQLFQKEINFSPGVRINGKRTNSIWKKNLEKREILKMALASYQLKPKTYFKAASQSQMRRRR